MKGPADVIIIGGGVAGSSIAFTLLADGFKGKIVVVEKDPTYQYASSSLAAGGIRQQFGTPINIELTRYSVDFYERSDEIMTVDGEKANAEFQQVGYLFLGNQRNWPVLQRRIALQKDQNVPVAVLDPGEIQRIIPDLHTEDLTGATLGSKDGVLDPIRRQIFVCLPAPHVHHPFPMVIDPGGAHWRSETGRRILAAKARKDELPGFNFQCERGYFMDDIWPDRVHRYPPFDRLRMERGWAGLYAVPPDENATYGEHPEIKGLYLANGFSGPGLMMAPATGKAMSEIIRLGRSETIDVSCLSLERFRTGKLIIEEAVI